MIKRVYSFSFGLVLKINILIFNVLHTAQCNAEN